MQGPSQPGHPSDECEEDYTFGCDQPATRVPPCAGFVDFNDKKRRKLHRGTETEVNAENKKQKRSAVTRSQDNMRQFRWTDDLHDDFLAALFDVGLQHSTPVLLHQFSRPESATQPLSTIPGHTLKEMLRTLNENRENSVVSFTGMGRLLGYGPKVSIDNEEDFIFNRLVIMLLEIVHCHVNEQTSTGSCMSRIMSSVDLQKILKNNLQEPIRKLKLIAITMRTYFDKDAPASK